MTTVDRWDHHDAPPPTDPVLLDYLGLLFHLNQDFAEYRWDGQALTGYKPNPRATEGLEPFGEQEFSGLTYHYWRECKTLAAGMPPWRWVCVHPLKAKP